MDAATRNRVGWLVLRLALAGLVAAHGYYRLFVGAGRNGVEFSVLLIFALLCVSAQHAPATKEKAP